MAHSRLLKTIPVSVVALLLGLAACESADAPTQTASTPDPMSAPASNTATAVPTPAPTHTAAPTPQGRRGGTLRIAQTTDPASCDLHTLRGAGYTSVHACNPMLSQLLMTPAADHSAIEPDLAESWSVAADGTDWTFHLRAGVTWHDGTPFTSDDVKFSLDRIVAAPPAFGIGRAGIIARYISGAENVTTPDSLTVKVQTSYAAAAFLPALTSPYLSIYPRKATSALEPPSMVNFSSVVGTGPFEAGESIRGSSYTLNRNAVYYEPRLPYLDSVVFLVMPEPAVKLAGLNSHSVDAIAVITEPEATSIAKSGLAINIYSTPSMGGNTLQMNLSKPPFDNPLVRAAVNEAMSRADAELALGESLVGAIMPPGTPWAIDESLLSGLAGLGPAVGQARFPDPAADRARAKSLLKQAGYENGLEVTINVRGEPFSQMLGEFAAGQLALVGIKAAVVPVEFVAYQTLLAARDFQMIAHSHSFALDDPDAVLFDHYSCRGVENYPGLCDPALDQLMDRQSRTADPSERKRLVDEIQARIWNTNAKIWFQWSVRKTPVWSNVHGMEPGGPSLYQGRRLDRAWLD